MGDKHRYPGYNAESATDGGANWIAFIGAKEVLAIDTYTVEIPIDNYDIRWPTFILGQSGLGLSITSKTAYDTKGESWVRDNVIGTGPFEVKNYSRDDVLELTAIEGHHRITPEVKTYILRAIPDDDTAKAALQTGAVDVSDVALDEMTSLQKAGFEVISAGAGSFHSISSRVITGKAITTVRLVHPLPMIPQENVTPTTLELTLRFVTTCHGLEIPNEMTSEAHLQV